jgi:hypothetical protein
MRLEIPVDAAMVRIPLPQGRLLVPDGDPAEVDGIGQLGRLLGRAGADLAWAFLDDGRTEIASWVALRLLDTDGVATAEAVRARLRADGALSAEQHVRETPIGVAERLRQRHPVEEQGGRHIVADTVAWSWDLRDGTMLLMTSSTTQLMYAEHVAAEVDGLAERISVAV